MKHLKKILLALVVVSMLVSAVVTIAVAAGDDDYTGTVEEASAVLDEAIAASKLADRQKLLAQAYTVILTVNPEDEGYDDLVSLYDEVTFKHAVALYDAVVAATNVNAESTALATLYVHVAGAPVLDENVVVTIKDRYVCGICGHHYFATEAELEDGLPDTFICPSNVCASKNTDYDFWTLSFPEFEELYVSININIVDTFFDMIYQDVEFTMANSKTIVAPASIKSMGYYDYLIVQTALKNYMEKVLELKFVAPDNGYQGDVVAASAILGKINNKSTVSDVKAILAEVYGYMVETPIDPTTDEFADFYADYIAVAEELSKALFEEVDKAEGHVNKIAVLNSIKDYLTASPISQDFVNAFNAKVESVKNEYTNASDVLDNEDLTISEDIVPTVEYTSADDFKALIEACEAIEDAAEFAEDRRDAIVAVYNAISTKPLDPQAEEYEALLARYAAVRDAFIEELFASVENAKEIVAKAAALAAVYEFLGEYPLTSAAAERYNTKAAEIKAICDGVLAQLDADGMALEIPEATAPTVTVTKDMLNALLADVNSAKNLDEKKVAATKLYTYLMVSEMGDVTQFAEFTAAYELTKNALTEALLATITEAEAEDKVAAFTSVSAYLASTPYSKAAIVAFNEAVAGAVAENADLADTLNPLKLTCSVMEAEALLAKYGEAEGVQACMDATRALYAYLTSTAFDYTDSAFVDMAVSVNAAFADMNGKLQGYIDEKDDINEKYEAIDEVRTFLLSVPFSTTAYIDYNDKLAAVKNDVENVIASLSTAEDEPAGVYVPLSPALSVLGALLEEVKAAENFTDKMAAFVALYDACESLYTDADEALAFAAEYLALCAAMEDELVAYVDSFINPADKVNSLREAKAFIETVPFSSTVITKFNAKVEAAKNANYSESADAVTAAFEEPLAYTAPEGYTGEVADLRERVDAITDKDTLFAAYYSLADDKYDFLATGFAECIADYDAKKSEIGKQLADKINNVSDNYVSEINADLANANLDTIGAPLYALYNGELSTLVASHIEAFSELYNLLKTDCISSEMVRFYNEKREEILYAEGSYADLHEAALALYSTKVKTLHSHLMACPVDDLGTLESKLDGVEYAELEGYIFSYNMAEKLSPDTPHIYRKSMVSKINAYLKLCSISKNYSGFESFLTLYKDVAFDYVDGLLAEVDEKADDDKITALNEIKDILNTTPFSKEVVQHYNNKIDALLKEYTDMKTLLDAEANLDPDELISTPEYVEGAVEALNALLEDVNEALAGDDYDAKLEAFAAIYTYLTSNRINPEEEGYTEFKEAYDDVRKSFYDAVMEKFNSAPDIIAKYDELLALKEYLGENALSQSIIDAFNANTKAWAKDLKDLNAALVSNPVKYTEIPGPLKEGYYPGKLSAIQAYVKDIAVDLANPDADIDLAVVAQQISMVHNYLRDQNKAVNPNQARYDDILNEYYSKCDVFFAKCMEAYNNGASLDAKAEALKNVHSYIVTAPYSKDAVDAYNVACQLVGGEIVGYALILEQSSMQVVSPFGKTEALMKVVDNSASNIIKYMRAFADFYEIYTNTIFDITDSQYNTLVDSYNKKCVAIANKLFGAIGTATTPSAKYEALITAKDYITTYPISADAIDNYNEELVELKAIDFEAIAETFRTGCEKLSYTTIYYKGTVAGLNEILEDTESEKKVVAKNAYDYLAANKIDPDAEGYEEAMVAYEELYTAALAEMIDAAKAKTDANEKKNAFVEIADLLTAAPFSAAAVEDFNTALEDAGVFTVNSLTYYTGTTEEVTEILSAGGADALVATYEYLETKRIDAKAGSNSKINEKIRDVRADLEAKTEAQKKVMNSDVNLDDYSMKGTAGYYNVNKNFEDSVLPWTFNWEDVGGGTYDVIGEERDANGRVTNKYLNVMFNVYGTGPFYDISVGDTSKGIVLEFDMACFDGEARASFSCVEYGLSTNARISMQLGRILSNNIETPAGVVLKENVFTEGEWTHIAYAYDPETLIMKVYVEYEYVGEYKLSSSEPIKFTTLRLTTQGSSGTYRSLALDNFTTYPGTSPRTLSMYDSMSDIEKFEHFFEYFQSSNNTPTNRNIAYNQAKSLAESSVVAAQCADKIAELNAYDYVGNILGDARKEALNKLESLVNGIGEITTSNTQNKLASIEIIEAFVASSTYLDKSDERYLGLMEIVSDAKVVISHLDNVKSLLDALSRFDRATTLTSMTKHAESAIYYFDLCKFDVGDNYAVIANDPLVTEFLDKVGSETLVEYFNSIAGRIAERTKVENSQRIIDCVKFIQILEGYDPTASAADKKAFWDGNYDYIDKYILIIRSVVSENNYDPEYTGVGEYLEVYNEINEYFYANLQKHHVDVIKERLDQYPKTQSYIEKKGICVYIDNYLKNNDVDLENAEIAALLELHAIYGEEVESFKNEYQQLLNQNTAAFIALVDRMDANSSNFKVLEQLVNDANENFYYSMNVDFEDEEMSLRVNEAIEKFKAYSALIEETIEASKQFVTVARKLKVAKTTKDIYLALVQCSEYIDNANSDAYDGVAEAKELYETMLAEYNASIADANVAISEANDAVCAVRSQTIAQIVLSIIKNIFTN